jgi:SMI1-KNR4 cell-wall
MPEIVWRTSDSPAEPRELERVQAYWSLRFPEDYLACVRQHNGGSPAPYHLTSPTGAEEIFDHLFSFTPGSREHIVVVAAGLFEYLPVGVLPFAEDGAGNYFVFDFRSKPEAPSIAFIFHENHDELTGYFALTPIASSFTELLGLLHPDPDLEPDDDDDEEE